MIFLSLLLKVSSLSFPTFPSQRDNSLCGVLIDRTRERIHTVQGSDKMSQVDRHSNL